MENQLKQPSNFWLILFVLYKYSLPIAAFIFLVTGWKHAHGFFGVIGLFIMSSLKAFVWPLVLLFS